MTDGISRFVYVTYIRTTPEKLWAALTKAEFIKQYWFGMSLETDWKVGSPWKMRLSRRRLADEGEVAECESAARLALRWRNQWSPELAAEGEAFCVIELEPVEGAVKLTISHSIARIDSKLIEGASPAAGRASSPTSSRCSRPARSFSVESPLADRLSRHGRADPRKRLQTLLLRHGQHRRPPRPSRRARHGLRRRFARADRQDRGVEAVHEVDIAVGAVVRQRLQLTTFTSRSIPRKDRQNMTAGRSTFAARRRA